LNPAYIGKTILNPRLKCQGESPVKCGVRNSECGIKKTLTLNYRQKKNFSLAEPTEAAGEKRIQDTGIRSQAMGFRFQDSGFRTQDWGF
jgi:hypothetical protein